MTAQQLYQEAYNAHYKQNNYSAAVTGYLQTIASFPNSNEARYSHQQIQNIAKSSPINQLSLSEEHTALLNNILSRINAEADKERAEKTKREEEFKKKEEELKKQQKASEQKVLELQRFITNMPFTTEDIACNYKVVAPIFFNTTNKGIFSSAFTKLCHRYSKSPYREFLVRPQSASTTSSEFGTFLASLLDGAFEMGADAVIGVKMDFDLDTTNFGAFYLQMYGTAVKLL